MKAAGYIRVSGTSQAKPDKISLPEQEREIREHCTKREWELVDIYRDAAKSGRYMKLRTEMQRLLHDASKHLFDYVIVWDVTRFGRSLLDTKRNVDTLDKLGVFLISIDQGVDTSQKDKTKNLVLNILSSIAEYESDNIRDRTQGSIVARLRLGEVFIGHPPFGYQWNKATKSIELHPREAPIFTRIWTDYVDLGKSLTVISEELTKEKVVARRRKGTNWHSSTISNMLHNESYHTGIITTQYQGETYIYKCEPLIPSHKFKEMMRMLRDANTRAGRPATAAQDFLLHQKLLCGVCGAHLSTRYGTHRLSSGSKSRWYCCTWHEKPNRHLRDHARCSFQRVNADEIEEYILNELCKVIRGEYLTSSKSASHEKRETELREQIEYANRELKKKELKLSSLDAALEQGLPGRIYAEKLNLFTAEKLEIAQELAEAIQSLKNIEQVGAETEIIQKFMMDNHIRLHLLTERIRNAPHGLQQRLIKGMVDGFIVVPEDRNLNNLEIPWKFNLPLIKDVLSQLPAPEPDGTGGGIDIGTIDKDIWEKQQALSEPRKGSTSEGLHRQDLLLPGTRLHDEFESMPACAGEKTCFRAGSR